eukprot:CAMPEP_0114684402 /NCGR_PEP_ID=MMETSP0191-20121206/59063_1 /TAXON_ID=126664 /ORGANISM="Sorites sp." /LENGTH=228 /DNA_ID=CAMNT_0001967091 /DNA_START=121 /DNA_END=808 /DNA_ORIENTATION=+
MAKSAKCTDTTGNVMLQSKAVPSSTSVSEVSSDTWEREWEEFAGPFNGFVAVEEFAGPFNRVCRGAGPTDNNPAYFDEHLRIPSLEACKDLCLQELGLEGCKGVEYNVRAKRCEVWKRPEGIWAFNYPEKEGYTCLRFGWPGKYLIPVNGGLDQACRGPDGKNSDDYYVIEAVRHMEDCRARCVAAKTCRGVEFSKGRCEIWHSEIVTTEARTGFECLRYEPPTDDSA